MTDGRFRGRVALVTGAAQGQGRSHAEALAREGADVILLDVGPVASTATAVEGHGRRAVAVVADVRDADAVGREVDAAVAALGRLDVVCVNAGIVDQVAPTWELLPEQWASTIGVNLTGAFHTVRATVPHLLAGARGGSIVFTGSTAAVRGAPNIAHYTASKHGLVGLMRSLARELAPHSIRVNAVHPTTVDTPMVNSEAFYGWARPDLEAPTAADVDAVVRRGHALPVGWLDAADVTNAVLWLASDEARYVTGHGLVVDAGATLG